MNRRKFFAVVASVPMFGAFSALSTESKPLLNIDWNNPNAQTASNSNRPYSAGSNPVDTEWGELRFVWDDPKVESRLWQLGLDRAHLTRIFGTPEFDRQKTLYFEDSKLPTNGPRVTVGPRKGNRGFQLYTSDIKLARW